jgi:hypothetical protein
MSLRTRPVVAIVAVIAGLAASLPVAAAEPEAVPVAPISVAIAATSTGGPSGIGLLAANDQGTGVQVLVTGALAGTNATIHRQACGSIDGTALVGLVGTLASNGQTQATIPAPLATLADGSHVIALHPGLDLGRVVACGAIPQTDVGPAPEPPPPVDDTCTGVPAWVTSAQARLARIQELETLASNAQMAGIPAYVTQLATNIGETRAMADLARAETPPPGASDAHTAFVAMLDSLAAAASDLQVSMIGQDSVAVQRALISLNAAYQKLTAVRTDVTELAVKCPG